VLLRAEGDLLGDPSPETVTLHADGTLVAGPARANVELTGANEYWMQQQARLRVVTLDRAGPTRGVLVSLPIDAEEDPSNRHRLFLLDGSTLRLVLDVSPGTYGPIDLDFPGDGTMHYIEDGWSACERLHHPARPAVRDEVVWRLDGDTMRESERRPTRQRQDCSQLAACPFVYVLDGERAAFAGEILRNLRGFDAYALQELSLPAGGGDGVHVRLTEEKDEVTYLDEIYLEVDGVRYEPVSCSSQSALFCRADHRAFVMRRGDSLDLSFDAPAGSAVLYARGYYVPLAS
jgi:hypothetical protein